MSWVAMKFALLRDEEVAINEIAGRPIVAKMHSSDISSTKTREMICENKDVLF